MNREYGCFNSGSFPSSLDMASLPGEYLAALDRAPHYAETLAIPPVSDAVIEAEVNPSCFGDPEAYPDANMISGTPSRRTFLKAGILAAVSGIILNEFTCFHSSFSDRVTSFLDRFGVPHRKVTVRMCPGNHVLTHSLADRILDEKKACNSDTAIILTGEESSAKTINALTNSQDSCEVVSLTEKILNPAIGAIDREWKIHNDSIRALVESGVLICSVDSWVNPVSDEFDGKCPWDVISPIVEVAIVSSLLRYARKGNSSLSCDNKNGGLFGRRKFLALAGGGIIAGSLSSAFAFGKIEFPQFRMKWFESLVDFRIYCEQLLSKGSIVRDLFPDVDSVGSSAGSIVQKASLIDTLERNITTVQEEIHGMISDLGMHEWLMGPPTELCVVLRNRVMALNMAYCMAQIAMTGRDVKAFAYCGIGHGGIEDVEFDELESDIRGYAKRAVGMPEKILRNIHEEDVVSTYLRGKVSNALLWYFKLFVSPAVFGMMEETKSVHPVFPCAYEILKDEIAAKISEMRTYNKLDDSKKVQSAIEILIDLQTRLKSYNEGVFNELRALELSLIPDKSFDV